jgi:hypothetical protein
MAIEEEIRIAASRRLLFLPHAIMQMSRPERLISTEEIQYVIEHGEVIEDYPDDRRGHSCLLLGTGENDRAIHIVCSPKPDYLAIITAYLPDPAIWSEDFKQRRT